MSARDDGGRKTGHAHEREGTRRGRPSQSGGESRSRKSQRDPRSGDRVPPKSVEQALAEAAEHTRNALAEGLLAGRSLLDAASLALRGRPTTNAGQPAASGDAARVLARAAASMEALARQVRASSPDGSRALIEALLGALDSEIMRWEDKARQDPDARAVLRAFLGLRELLWELGMRPAGTGGSPGSPGPTAPDEGRRARGRTTRPPARGPSATHTPDSDSTTARSDGASPPRRRRVQRVEVER